MKKIVVSACLLGENCKYNGENNVSEKLLGLLSSHDDIEVISVCPEVAGGLPTPRLPAEIVDGVVLNKDGVSVDAEYRAGVASIIEGLRDALVDGDIEAAILQSRSPSCGVRQIYDGSFGGRLIPGKGLFARALADAGVRLIDIADL